MIKIELGEEPGKGPKVVKARDAKNNAFRFAETNLGDAISGDAGPGGLYFVLNEPAAKPGRMKIATFDGHVRECDEDRLVAFVIVEITARDQLVG